jgi:galactokinase
MHGAGAGWGGCTVSLVQEDKVAGFLEQLRANYFSKCLADGRVSEEQVRPGGAGRGG